MLRPKSLQSRLIIYLLLPVGVFSFLVEFTGLIYARDNLLAQWSEASLLKLQRAANQIDLRLANIREWLDLYKEAVAGISPRPIQEWILAELKRQDGVLRVELKWLGYRENRAAPAAGSRQAEARAGSGTAPGRYRHLRLTPPRYDSILEHETLSLISDIRDENDTHLGSIEVVVSFDGLVEGMVTSSWWQRNQTFLVDDSGRVLSCNVPGGRTRIGENGDPLELKTLKALEEKPSGTILGEGRPPSTVSGFYRLEEAPWSIIVIAPGRDVLAPIIRFRTYYILFGTLSVLLVLILMRLATKSTMDSIKRVSVAANRIAQGHYDTLAWTDSPDEVGQLIRSFNSMVIQLGERMRLKEAMDIAMEVQQSLLPAEIPCVPGFDIAGKSIYCDETGGDYYDVLHVDGQQPGRLILAVGDVAGHGIGAALLMTTARAFLRAAMGQSCSIAVAVTEVNKLLCLDTGRSGNFMTLFVALLSPAEREIAWVRAGHDPAILYDSATDSFRELRGEGIALGVHPAYSFQEYTCRDLLGGQIILIGTDGIWEAENTRHERFGKSRLQDVIRQNSHLSSGEILDAIVDAVAEFRESTPPRDDITMMVIKALDGSGQ